MNDFYEVDENFELVKADNWPNISRVYGDAKVSLQFEGKQFGHAWNDAYGQWHYEDHQGHEGYRTFKTLEECEISCFECLPSNLDAWLEK